MRDHASSLLFSREEPLFLAGYSLLIPFSHHASSQFLRFAKTDCWCDEKKELAMTRLIFRKLIKEEAAALCGQCDCPL